jgi:hypothetical protein
MKVRIKLGRLCCCSPTGDVLLSNEPPWEQHPHELVSWLEMLQFSAGNFYWCGHILANLEADCLFDAIPGTGDEPMFQMFSPLKEESKEKTLRRLKSVKEEFLKIGLRITAETVEEVIQEFETAGWKSRNCQWLMDQLKAIDRLSQRELKGKAFFYVPAERTKFWPKVNDPHLFGNDVANAFPSAAFDIVESGVCLALSRGTASVLHSMRVLEIGLTALGTKFGVSLAHKNWAPAIGEIESKVREMHKDPVWKLLPDCKEQQEFYAQAASHFGILKDAWRNYTMHARGVYTDEMAEDIFNSVKGFMQKLAATLRE